MIAGHIDCLEQAAAEFPPAILTALKTLAAMDFKALEDGVLVTSQAEMKFSLFHAETAPAASRRPETHLKNIDIHYLVDGEEALAYQPFSPELVVAERLPEDDNVFYEKRPQRQSLTVLAAGGFAVYFPWDVHLPLCTLGKPSRVRKIVVKVPLSLL